LCFLAIRTAILLRKNTQPAGRPGRYKHGPVPAVQRQILSRPPVAEGKLHAVRHAPGDRETRGPGTYAGGRASPGSGPDGMSRYGNRTPVPVEHPACNLRKHPCFAHNPFVIDGFAAFAVLLPRPRNLSTKKTHGAWARRVRRPPARKLLFGDPMFRCHATGPNYQAPSGVSMFGPGQPPARRAQHRPPPQASLCLSGFVTSTGSGCHRPPESSGPGLSERP
jgi:hypothetical protein